MVSSPTVPLASIMAWRSEPGPESAVVVTSNVAAIAVTAEKTTTTAMLRRSRVFRKVDFHCAVPCLERSTGRKSDDGFIALMLKCVSDGPAHCSPVARCVSASSRPRMRLGGNVIFRSYLCSVCASVTPVRFLPSGKRVNRSAETPNGL